MKKYLWPILFLFVSAPAFAIPPLAVEVREADDVLPFSVAVNSTTVVALNVSIPASTQTATSIQQRTKDELARTSKVEFINNYDGKHLHISTWSGFTLGSGVASVQLKPASHPYLNHVTLSGRTTDYYGIFGHSESTGTIIGRRFRK